tara:strand:+ start:216 stop:458 length:243 start_codon:yes stop_codon:yes gene_type:complete
MKKVNFKKYNNRMSEMEIEYEEACYDLIVLKKKMFYVDIKTKMGHPLTRYTPKSHWVCHNRECKIHTTCKQGLCTMGCDE